MKRKQGRSRITRVGALACVVAATAFGGPTPPAKASGPTFDLATIADKTYDFRLRGQGATNTGLAVFGSFHVNASGTIDTAKGWMSAVPGPKFLPITIAFGSVNTVAVEDTDAGIYRFSLTLGSGTEARLELQAWIKLTDTRGRHGVLNGVWTYSISPSEYPLVGDGDIVSP